MLTLKVVQSGSYTLALPTMKYQGGTAYAVSTSAATDILQIYYDGSTYYAGYGNAFA